MNRHEEFYATIIFFVERHYLRKHSKSSGLASEHSSSTLDASFAENFYGLKRRRHPWVPTDRVAVAVRGAPVAEKLRDREIWQSLFFLVCQLISCDTIFVDSAQVAVPYFRAKTHDYYEQLGGGVSSDILEDGGDGRHTQPHADDVCHFCAKKLTMLTDTYQSLSGRWRRAYKKNFPWVNTLFELWLVGCNVAYLFERTPFYRPWLAWIGVDLRRLNADDFVSVTSAASHPYPKAKFFASSL